MYPQPWLRLIPTAILCCLGGLQARSASFRVEAEKTAGGFRLDPRPLLDFVHREQKNGSIRLDFALPGSPGHTFDLEPIRIFRTGEIITYKGHLADDAQAEVRMTISDSFIHALIFKDGQRGFETVGLENGVHLLRRFDPEYSGNPGGCGLEGNPSAEAPPPRFDPPLPRIGSFPNPAMDYPILGIVCDRQCLQVAGTKEKFETDLQTILNIAQAYYAEFSVGFVLNPVYYVESAQNPWSDVPGSYSSNADNFRKWASSKYPSFHNAALLFTGQNFSGIDYAWVGHLCEGDSYRYGQIDYAYKQPITQRANLTTHELGHILGCNHAATSRTLIMSPTIYDGKLTWDQTSMNSIRTTVAKFRSCFKPFVATQPVLPAISTGWEPLGNGDFRLLGASSSHPLTLSIWKLRGDVSRRIVLQGFSGNQVVGLGGLPAGFYAIAGKSEEINFTRTFRVAANRNVEAGPSAK